MVCPLDLSFVIDSSESKQLIEKLCQLTSPLESFSNISTPACLMKVQPKQLNGWHVYNPVADFQRMGISVQLEDTQLDLSNFSVQRVTKHFGKLKQTEKMNISSIYPNLMEAPKEQ